jgi:hypothetical protein
MMKRKRHSKRLFNRKVNEIHAYWGKYPRIASMAEIRALDRNTIHGWYKMTVVVRERVRYLQENLRWEE